MPRRPTEHHAGPRPAEGGWLRPLRVPVGISAIVVVISGIVIGTGVWGGSTASSRFGSPSTEATQPWHLAWRSENAFPHRTSTTETCRFAALLTAGGDYVRAEFTGPVVPGK